MSEEKIELDKLRMYALTYYDYYATNKSIEVRKIENILKEKEVVITIKDHLTIDGSKFRCNNKVKLQNIIEILQRALISWDDTHFENIDITSYEEDK